MLARRHGRQGEQGGLLVGVVVFAGVFFVWARAVLLRPSGTSASGGQGFFLGMFSCLRIGNCFY